MIDWELVSLGPNKLFQTLKHHNLLSVLRLGSCQSVQRSLLLCLWGGVLGDCSIIHHHYNLIFVIGRGSGQLWQVLVKSTYPKNNFLISQPKQTLCVLKRTVSMRQFF